MLRGHPRLVLALICLAIAVVISGGCALGRGPVRPAVTILSPQNGQRLTVGQEVEVKSVALDTRGIDHIELWVDGVRVQNISPDSSQEPTAWETSFRWTPGAAGRHQLAVQAVNRAGVTSAPFAIVVDVVPAEAISMPATPTPTATSPPTQEQPSPTPPPAACLNNATFVADITVPDETPFRPGDTFEKIWRMRNSGTCPWDSRYAWVFESGEAMTARRAVEVPPTVPGADADIAVPMTAPAQPGRYTGRWRMQGPDGQFFGQRATVIIVVIPAGLTPPAAPARLEAEFAPPDLVILRWVDQSNNEQGVRIYTDDGRTLLAEIPTPDVTEARIQHVPCGQEVRFIVRTYNQAGESEPGASATLRTPDCAAGLPVIHYFTAEPAEIAAGQKALLRWDLEGAREARIFPGGEAGVVAPGQMEVSPTQTTTYRLVAVNELGTVEARVTVTVREGAAGVPAVRLTISPDTVGQGEPFRITVSGEAEGGLNSIWWWGEGTGDAELDAVHAYPCQGAGQCSQGWDVRTEVNGELTFRANARSNAGVQADQGGALPAARLRVIPVLVRARDVRVSGEQCLDLETGSAGDCGPAMDVRFLYDAVDGWNLQGVNGGQLVGLGVQPAIEAISYRDVRAATGWLPQVAVGPRPGASTPTHTLVAVRTGAGRFAKLFLRADAGALLVEVLTYAE